MAVLIAVEILADGTVRDLESRPPVCERCGEIPEEIIELNIEVVTARDRSAALCSVPQD
jgi:hypothetical protein